MKDYYSDYYSEMQQKRQQAHTMAVQQRYYHIQDQYNLIRPFCPVCSVRHEAGAPRGWVTPHGIALCRKCADAKRIYPVPLILLEGLT